jgi:hypothetical protein
MTTEPRPFRRDLFEIENARNLTRDELVSTFVPTKTFWRLISAKHHIVLGSRGSGKTALAKMLSHDHLSRLSTEDRARHVVEAKSFVGIYVPTKLEWVGGLKNKPWQTEQEKEEFFQWRLNVATCLAFLITLRSCLDTYVPDPGIRARCELELANQLSLSWSDDEYRCDTIRALQHYVEDVEHKKQQQLARVRATGRLRTNELPAGIALSIDLFAPLRRAIALTSRILGFPEDCVWLLCLDEAEFLDPIHHRILNSHLRAHSGNLFIKITTMPYAHHTLATNTGAALNVGHDFEYVYIDEDPVLTVERQGQEGMRFANALFERRAKVSGWKYQGVSLSGLLGPSELLDRRKEDWGPDSKNMVLLRKYGSADTNARADELRAERGIVQFRNQIGRKMHAALVLRDEVERKSGRGELDLYAGQAMIVRCGDANPRRLIRIYNSLLLEADWRRDTTQGVTNRVGLKPLSSRAQTRILTAFATSTLVRVQSEPDIGPELYALLRRIGLYLRHTLYKEPLTTDQVSSIRIDNGVTREHWRLIQNAVGLGLLYPNVSANNPDQMPEREGTFHFAYVLAPAFRILPRRGRARSLSFILSRPVDEMDFLTFGSEPGAPQMSLQFPED